MTFPSGSRRLAVFAGFAMMALFLFSSCRGSGTLTSSVNTPSGNTVSATRVNGSASGGLSPIKAGTVTLYQAGNPSALATASTDSNGAFSLSLPPLNANGIYYLVVTNGSAGSGNNSNLQLMALLGTGATIPSTTGINELTTAASLLVANNLNFLQESSGGQITLATPTSTAAVTSGRFQYLNFINLTNGTLNTANSNLTSTQTSALATMANAFAACVENSGQCATLFSNAANSSGNAANVLDAGYKMLNGLTSISGINTLASSLSSSTGYTIPSTPSTLNVNFAGPVKTFNVGGGNQSGGFAFDASGTLWMFAGTNNLVTISPTTGGISTLLSTGDGINSIVIDAAGNVWFDSGHGGNTLTKVSPSGSVLGTITGNITMNTQGMAIDASGNLWVSNDVTSTSKFSPNGAQTNFSNPLSAGTMGPLSIDASGNVWELITVSNTDYLTEFSPTGSVIGTTAVFSNEAYGAMAIDPSGLVWTGVNASISRFSSIGNIVNQTAFSGLLEIKGMAIDAAGNAWMLDISSNHFYEISPTGKVLLGNYPSSAASNKLDTVAIDASGNVWTAGNNGTVYEFQNAAGGAEFFPYSGPIFPF